MDDTFKGGQLLLASHDYLAASQPVSQLAVAFYLSAGAVGCLADLNKASSGVVKSYTS